MLIHRLVVLGALLAPAVVLAQTPAILPVFALQRLGADTSGLGSLVVGTGRVLEPGQLRVSLQAHYEHLPLNFVRSWDPAVTTLGLVENKVSGQLGAAVGVLPWLQVGAHLAYILDQRGNAFMGLRPPEGGGLESAWVSARVAPWRMNDGAPLNLAVELTAALPVGQERLLGREDYALLPRLQAGVQGEGYQVGGELGVLVRPRHDLSALTGRPQDVLGSEVRLAAAVTSRGPNKTSTRPEVSFLLNLPVQGGRPSAEVLVGVRKHAWPGLDLFFLGGPGVGTAIDMPTLRVIAGAAFFSSTAD